ncbi:MAG: dihydrolipoyl dehydrogenase [Chlamydiales bacterium]|nr:dihydrolipoyl dehydrogenase [Chlamydiales bacterium]
MPEKFDLLVIGSGPGGYVAAIRAAQLGMRVACIDKREKLGGTCLNVGCIPSKALLESSHLYAKMKSQSSGFGIDIPQIDFNLPKMMERKSRIITGFNEGIGALFKKNKIATYTGTASLLSANSISVAGITLEGAHIVLATGSEPTPLPFLPFDGKRVLSSTDVLSLEKIPLKMAVIGAGVIGVELGSVYNRLGSQVLFIEFCDRICPTLDESISKELMGSLQKQGMEFCLSTKVVSAQVSEKGISLKVEKSNASYENIESDVVLVAIGRRPCSQELNLEKLGIALDSKGMVPVNGQFQTKIPSIFAIGDLIDGPMLAHKASEEGVAVAEIIAGQTASINYAAIPNVIYTHPEVASVGLTEQEAKTLNLDPISATCPFKSNSRARTSQEEEGFVKIIAQKGTDQILGIHIFGAHASEMIAQGCLAIASKTKVLDLAHLPCAHPTLSESLKEAALALHKKAIHR